MWMVFSVYFIIGTLVLIYLIQMLEIANAKITHKRSLAIITISLFWIIVLPVVVLNKD